MNIFKSCKERLFDLNQDDFDELALEIYRLQSRENLTYRSYHEYLGIDPLSIEHFEEIPFLPIEFFKTADLKTGNWESEVEFRSSGTTGQERSTHFIEDLDFYRKISLKNFEYFFGDISQYHILALLPSYLERNDSSLVFMVDHFIRQSGSEASGFYLDNMLQMLRDIDSLKKSGKKIMLWGVSFSLLDLAEQYSPDLNDCLVIETGGMKGRREELTKAELHEHLEKGLHVDKVYSEYGMTELLSQAYSLGEGQFSTPPWMRMMIREVNDPFQNLGTGQTGGLNIIDLANVHSCSFIETKDLGRLHPNGNFEVLGRYDNSDIRGCNLLVN